SNEVVIEHAKSRSPKLAPAAFRHTTLREYSRLAKPPRGALGRRRGGLATVDMRSRVPIHLELVVVRGREAAPGHFAPCADPLRRRSRSGVGSQQRSFRAAGRVALDARLPSVPCDGCRRRGELAGARDGVTILASTRADLGRLRLLVE